MQAPDGVSTIEIADDATFSALRAAISASCGIPAAQQELRCGFPPRVVEAADGEIVASAISSGDRVLVRPSGAAAPSVPQAGGGRKKPQQVRRLVEGAAPRDLPQAAASADGGGAAASDAPVEAAAPAPEAAAAGRKRKAGGGGGGSSEPDPLALTMASARAEAGGGAGGGKAAAKGGAAPAKVRRRSIEQLASEYYLGGPMQTAAAGGGKTGDYLTELGMVEHRVNAISTGRFELVVLPPKGKGPAAISATFKGVRKQVCEVVQMLDEAELRELFAALASRCSSRRGGGSSSLLGVGAMAARSPTALWSIAHAFDGDITAGVEQLASP